MTRETPAWRSTRAARRGRRIGCLWLLCGGTTGCASSNPVGFWDQITLTLDIEGEPATVQEDFGTIEFTERGGLTCVARYRYTAPGAAPLDSGLDTGGSAALDPDDRLVPRSPPMLIAGSWEDSEDSITQLDIDGMRLSGAEQTAYRANAMTYEVAEAVFQDGATGSVRMQLNR
jgi:hypothetical protein